MVVVGPVGPTTTNSTTATAVVELTNSTTATAVVELLMMGVRTPETC